MLSQTFSILHNMRIAIDIREALAESPTGKGMWTKHVLNELEKRDVEIITFPKSDPTTYPTSPRLRGAGKLIPKKLIWHWKTHLKIRSLKPDIYLSPTSYIVPWLLGKSVPTAVVIHDLIAFDREPHDKKAQLIERLTLPRVLKTAKWIFTVSEATKNDLLKRFPKTDPGKVTIVHAGPTLSKESKSASTSSTFPHVTFAKVVNNERKQSSNHDERTKRWTRWWNRRLKIVKRIVKAMTNNCSQVDSKCPAHVPYCSVLYAACRDPGRELAGAAALESLDDLFRPAAEALDLGIGESLEF